MAVQIIKGKQIMKKLIIPIILLLCSLAIVFLALHLTVSENAEENALFIFCLGWMATLSTGFWGWVFVSFFFQLIKRNKSSNKVIVKGKITLPTSEE